MEKTETAMKVITCNLDRGIWLIISWFLLTYSDTQCLGGLQSLGAMALTVAHCELSVSYYPRTMRTAR